MAPPSRQAILSLYSSLLRASNQFSSYNFREYFIRNTKRKFREIQSEKDVARIQQMYNDRIKELARIRRMTLVNALYGGRKLAVESRGASVIPEINKQ